MRTPKPTRAIATALMLVAFGVCWRLAGPAQLGGTAHYVITHGISMEPEYYEGDLVVLRRSASYGKGDIVGYQSPTLDRTVLHRIEGRDSRGFITKGDNNTWLDLDRPRTADVIGEAWLHVPGAGRWLAKTRTPVGATFLITLAALTFFLGNEKKRRRERSGKGPQVPRIGLASFNERQKLVLGGTAAITAILLGLALFSFSQPAISAIAGGAAYEHVGDLTYSANVKRSPVYPSGQVVTGRPVFLRLVDEVDFEFDYRLRTDAQHSVSGDAGLAAVVSGASGWNKTIQIAPAREFRGNRVTVRGTLDFAQIQRISQQVQKMTGVTELGQNVAIVPQINLEGDIAGNGFAETFQQEVAFQMDALQFQLKADAEASGPTSQPFRLTAPGKVATSDMRANELPLPGISLDIRTGRTAGSIGMALGLLVLAVLWKRFSNPAHVEEASLIEAQYGEWLIPVESMKAQSQHKAVQVKSMEALVRLAELYERMILHEGSDGIHSYFVEEEGVVYYYQAVGEQKPPPNPTKGSVPTVPSFSGRKLREERRREEVERLRQELTDIESEVLREKAGPAEE